MSTETASARFGDLDLWPTQEAMAAMLEGQLAAAAAVGPAMAALAAAAEAAADRLRPGDGRLVYAGAGTSGRIAVQDGVELGPTFGWPRGRCVYALAGGEAALMASVEGAEDDAGAGVAAMADAAVNAADVAIVAAASGATPFAVAALREAGARGALTIGVSCNPGAPLLAGADHPILLDTGAEVLAGSTRMKAGTAQKIALNLLSTAIMVRLGHVYRGLMVGMTPSNAKLRVRGAGIVAAAAGIEAEAGAALLEAAGGNIKRAVLMAKGLSAADADALLAACGHNLRVALAHAAQ
jgi:N-acetylmuramic acid 6-phosphate etherase